MKRTIMQQGFLFLSLAATCLIVLLPVVDCSAQDTSTHRSAKSDCAAGNPALSAGEYLGQQWQIDENHLFWWDGKPYVRFGFTGNGELRQMRRLGFTQFTLMPAEEWAISGPDQKIPRSLDETTDRLEEAGATYYAGLNTFWPWRHGNLIAEADKATAFVRDVVDVSEHAGRRKALAIVVRLPIHRAEHQKVKVLRTHAVLFDLQGDSHHDLSGQVERVESIRASHQRPRDDAPGGWKAYRIRLGPVRFPESNRLRLVVAMEVLLDEVPNVNGLPALWKPGIRGYYRRSVHAFRPAYAKKGLRGMMFSDEINAFPVSLLTARAYLDVRRDYRALRAYRDWLSSRWGELGELNAFLGTRYQSFDEVSWAVPLHPFTARDAPRRDSDAPVDDPWSGLRTTSGMFESVEQFRRVSELQDEFRMWFYGHWLAEYAQQAKRIIGDVPVFVCSASIPGDADRYLAIHRWALRKGVDGLIRNHYGGRLDDEERESLRSVSRWMRKVQRESGRTKHLWANEIGYVRRGATDAQADPGEAPDLPFGAQWAFPSKHRLDELLVLLTENGYRGFNRFLMNPSAPKAGQEIRWMAELRRRTVALAVTAKQQPTASQRQERP